MLALDVEVWVSGLSLHAAAVFTPQLSGPTQTKRITFHLHVLRYERYQDMSGTISVIGGAGRQLQRLQTLLASFHEQPQDPKAPTRDLDLRYAAFESQVLDPVPIIRSRGFQMPSATTLGSVPASLSCIGTSSGRALAEGRHGLLLRGQLEVKLRVQFRLDMLCI